MKKLLIVGIALIIMGTIYGSVAMMFVFSYTSMVGTFITLCTTLISVIALFEFNKYVVNTYICKTTTLAYT